MVEVSYLGSAAEEIGFQLVYYINEYINEINIKRVDENTQVPRAIYIDQAYAEDANTMIDFENLILNIDDSNSYILLSFENFSQVNETTDTTSVNYFYKLIINDKYTLNRFDLLNKLNLFMNSSLDTVNTKFKNDIGNSIVELSDINIIRGYKVKNNNEVAISRFEIDIVASCTLITIPTVYE